MQAELLAFTFLRLTLTYFHLECKKLVRIPDSVLDTALALRGKETVERKTVSLVM